MASKEEANNEAMKTESVKGGPRGGCDRCDFEWGLSSPFRGKSPPSSPFKPRTLNLTPHE
jgi:hypothetical protein